MSHHGDQPKRKTRRTGIRIGKLNIEYFDLWAGKYGLFPLRDSITWGREPRSWKRRR